MRRIISPELVNGPFGDPALYLDFRLEKRAILFDMGDLEALPPRKILRLSDAFVTHAHMDHFCGFDRVLRVCLGRGRALNLYGPPGFIDRVGHKLAAYTWNLVGNYPANFRVVVHELQRDGELRSARFSSHAKFEREELSSRQARDGVLLDEPAFRVRSAFLDHDTTCLGFCFEEKAHVNVWKNRLDEMGVPTGAWLQQLKRAVIDGLPDGTPIHARWTDGAGEHERGFALGELKEKALEIVPGEKLCYVTDVVYHPANEARIAALGADADRLYIECVFLNEDAHHASRKYHLTAGQAGRIARAARAKNVMPFHFSPRYMDREVDLRAELEAARMA